MSIAFQMDELFESRKALRKEIEDKLPGMKAAYEKAKRDGALTKEGIRDVRMALATIERHLKNNKLKPAERWVGVFHDEMIRGGQ